MPAPAAISLVIVDSYKGKSTEVVFIERKSTCENLRSVSK